jgi:nucleotidyltransferase/DNA polymerase involved in DNA repair
MKTPIAVGHLDADCFYVSAERVRDSFLVGKPVGVLGNQGACVIARSYEMKYAGVNVAMPIWEARAICPEGIYIKRDFRWYEVLSNCMLEVVRDFSCRVEFHSIDEFFFVASPTNGRSFQGLAEAMRERIASKLNVPVTVGIARTRTLAKLISDAAKPFGALAVLDPSQETKLLAERPVTEITGIAGRRAKRLAVWNIETCLDLARADRRLWWELNGEAVTPIHPKRPAHKALSRGGSFGDFTYDPIVLYAWLIRNLERLIEELEYHEVLAGRLTVWVGYKDGRAGLGQTNLAVPTDRFDLLLDAARPCLRSAWLPRGPAWRMHLIAEHLAPKAQAQLSLFDRPEDTARADSVAQLKREVNLRQGRFAIRSAATLPLAAIYQDTANGYDICDIRGKSCF